MSTAYSNCTLKNNHINEEFYPVPCDYENLFELVETKSDEELDKMTSSIISPWPNTYSYTKQVAEGVIQKEGQGLPLGVVRPAISM